VSFSPAFSLVAVPLALTSRVRAFTYARSPNPREMVDTLGGEMVSEFECYQWLVECQDLQGFEKLTSLYL
jgi:hypothetical protein